MTEGDPKQRGPLDTFSQAESQQIRRFFGNLRNDVNNVVAAGQDAVRQTKGRVKGAFARGRAERDAAANAAASGADNEGIRNALRNMRSQRWDNEVKNNSCCSCGTCLSCIGGCLAAPVKLAEKGGKAAALACCGVIGAGACGIATLAGYGVFEAVSNLASK